MIKTINVKFPDDFKLPMCEKCPFKCMAEIEDSWCFLTDKYCESVFENKDKCPFYNGIESYNFEP